MLYDITNQTQCNPKFSRALSDEGKCGLRHFGREATKWMKQLDIIINLSQAHSNLMTDILGLSPFRGQGAVTDDRDEGYRHKRLLTAWMGVGSV